MILSDYHCSVDSDPPQYGSSSTGSYIIPTGKGTGKIGFV